jgi:hypothetical protein
MPSVEQPRSANRFFWFRRQPIYDRNATLLMRLRITKLRAFANSQSTIPTFARLYLPKADVASPLLRLITNEH